MIQAEGPQANIAGGGTRPRRVHRAGFLRMVRHLRQSSVVLPDDPRQRVRRQRQAATRWVEMLSKEDPRHLYSSASCGQTTPNRQCTEGGRRGIHGPGTDSDLRDVVARTAPLIGHEIGQWMFFPDFDEMKKYTGVLAPRNFAIVRDNLGPRGCSTWRRSSSRPPAGRPCCSTRKRSKCCCARRATPDSRSWTCTIIPGQILGKPACARALRSLLVEQHRKLARGLDILRRQVEQMLLLQVMADQLEIPRRQHAGVLLHLAEVRKEHPLADLVADDRTRVAGHDSAQVALRARAENAATCLSAIAGWRYLPAGKRREGRGPPRVPRANAPPNGKGACRPAVLVAQGHEAKRWMIAVGVDHPQELLFEKRVPRLDFAAHVGVGDRPFRLEHDALRCRRRRSGSGGHQEWKRMKFSP